jgi:hypothetical protein
MIQSINDDFQDVERGEASHASTVQRQQAQPGGIKRIWLSPLLSGRCTLYGLIDAVSKIVLAFVMGALYEDKSMALDLSADISAEPDPRKAERNT